MTSNPLPLLSLVDTRVLGVLVEKERTVPDTYPLSLNSLVAGCNQKNNRDPVLQISEGDVISALDRLKGHTLVVESSGSRVTRYSHNMERVLRVDSQSVALLAALMLRGPQTPGELRGNADRMHRFADISAVQAFLEELAERAAGALVVELPRQPGMREQRWMHLLSGPPAPELTADQTGVPDARRPATEDELALVNARVGRLEEEVAELRRSLGELRASLGLPES